MTVAIEPVQTIADLAQWSFAGTALAVIGRPVAHSLSPEMHNAARWYSTAEWAGFYRDGSVAKWLNAVTNFNVEVGAMQNPLPAEKYFDPSLFLDVVAKLKT